MLQGHCAPVGGAAPLGRRCEGGTRRSHLAALLQRVPLPVQGGARRCTWKGSTLCSFAAAGAWLGARAVRGGTRRPRLSAAALIGCSHCLVARYRPAPGGGNFRQRHATGAGHLLRPKGGSRCGAARGPWLSATLQPCNHANGQALGAAVVGLGRMGWVGAASDASFAEGAIEARARAQIGEILVKWLRAVLSQSGLSSCHARADQPAAMHGNMVFSRCACGTFR